MAKRFLQLAIPVLLLSVLSMTSCSGPTTPEPGDPRPAAIISIDSVSTLQGRTVKTTVRLTIPDAGDDRLDSLGGFNFRIAYDSTALVLQNVRGRLTAVSNWEYFAWRTPRFDALEGSPRRGTVRLMGMRDMTDGIPADPVQAFPNGAVAEIEFYTVAEPRLTDSTFSLAFATESCGDNVLFPERNPQHYYIADPEIDPESAALTDTADCERRMTIAPVLEFVLGSVHFLTPPDDRDTTVIDWP